MGIEDKCSYKKSYDNKTTTFESVGPGHGLYPCISCEGFDTKCKYYVTLMSLKMKKERETRYPAIFGPFTGEYSWP